MPDVRDIMSTALVTVTPDLSLRDLVEVMTREHVTGMPVVEGTRTVGVVTLSDVISFLATRPGVPTVRNESLGTEEAEGESGAGTVEGGIPGEDESTSAYFADVWVDAGGAVVERLAAPGSPEWDQLGEHTVREAMTEELLTVRPTTAVAEAARRMREAQVHRLLVMEGATLLGVVTLSDVAGVVAAQGADKGKRGRR